MSRRPLLAAELGLAAGLALVCALATVFVSSALAKPNRLDARLLTASRNADLATRLLGQDRATAQLGGNSTCAADLPVEAARLRRELTAMTAALQLQHATVEVSPEPTGRAGVLAPLRIRLSASGSYDAALGTLGRLTAARPVVFIDTVDLTSKTSFVTLAISGRVFCSAPQLS